MKTKMLHHKTGLFILSVGIAITLWLFLTLYQTQIATIKVPISYTGSESVKSRSDFPASIIVKIRGRGFELLRIRLQGAQAEYDLSHSNTETNSFMKNEVKLDLPSVLEVISLEPVSGAYMDSKESFSVKEVPVEFSFINKKAADDFIKMGFQAKLNTVQVSGNLVAIEKIKIIRTAKIDSRSLVENRNFYVKLILPSDDITLSSDSLLVIAKDISRSTKVFTNVSISSSDNQFFYPSSVTVRLKAASDKLLSIKQKDIQVQLDYTNEDNGIVPLKVSLPPDFELIDFTPRFVTLKR